MRLFASVFLLILSGHLCSCASFPSSPATSPKATLRGTNDQVVEHYLHFLNLAQLPDSVDKISGQGSEGLPDFLNSGYFSYQADGSYFDFLLTHDTFLEPSEFNSQISNINCTSSQFVQDFTWWTEDQIDLKEKECYKGIFFPNVHYLVYDKMTGDVKHFVAGMRG